MKQLLSLAVGIAAAMATTAMSTTLNVAISAPGTLEATAGEQLADIDSIVVSGNINHADIETLRTASLDGQLTFIDLSEAAIEGNTLPDQAFSAQFSNNTHKPLKLKELILPEGITEFGYHTFTYCQNLERINIPSTVNQIGSGAFMGCYALKNLILPEGVTSIPGSCFRDCYYIESVTLPSTITEIDNQAFYWAGLTSITLPEGLERIGQFGLSSNHFTHLEIPSTCKTLGQYSLYGLQSLTELVFKEENGEGIEIIPENCLNECQELQKIVFPSTVKEIRKDACSINENLKEFNLPEGLTRIEENAFNRSCATVIVVPSTVEYLGPHSLCALGLEAIYMKPVTPPATDFNTTINTTQQDINPFCFLNGRDAPFCNVPMYVPVGTKAAYLASTAWSFMTNIIETDTFPGEAGVEVIDADNSSAVTIIAGNGCAMITNNSATTQPYAVYTLDGRSMAAGTLTAGETSVQLSAGLYIVKAGNETAKISVH